MLVNYDDSDEEQAEEDAAPEQEVAKTVKIASIRPDCPDERLKRLTQATAHRGVTGAKPTAPVIPVSNLSKRTPDTSNKYLPDSDEEPNPKPSHSTFFQHKAFHLPESPQGVQDGAQQSGASQSTQDEMKKLVPSQIKLKRPNKPIEL